MSEFSDLRVETKVVAYSEFMGSMKVLLEDNNMIGVKGGRCPRGGGILATTVEVGGD